MRKATTSTTMARIMRSNSGFIFCAKRAPNCAPITEPSSSSPARTISTELVVVAWTNVVAAVTNRICSSEVPTTTWADMPSR